MYNKREENNIIINNTVTEKPILKNVNKESENFFP